MGQCTHYPKFVAYATIPLLYQLYELSSRYLNATDGKRDYLRIFNGMQPMYDSEVHRVIRQRIPQYFPQIILITNSDQIVRALQRQHFVQQCRNICR